MRGLRILLLAAALVGCCTAEQPASNAELVLSPDEEPIALTGLAVHPEYAACAASPVACTKLYENPCPPTFITSSAVRSTRRPPLAPRYRGVGRFCA